MSLCRILHVLLIAYLKISLPSYLILVLMIWYCFQMIDMYYSRYGLSTNAQSIKWTACQRYDNFKRNIDHNRLQEQALTFGLELKNHLIVSVSEASIQNAVSFAFESVKEEIVKLEVALSRSFFECTDDFTLGQEMLREEFRIAF